MGGQGRGGRGSGGGGSGLTRAAEAAATQWRRRAALRRLTPRTIAAARRPLGCAARCRACPPPLRMLRARREPGGEAPRARSGAAAPPPLPVPLPRAAPAHASARAPRERRPLRRCLRRRRRARRERPPPAVGANVRAELSPPAGSSGSLQRGARGGNGRAAQPGIVPLGASWCAGGASCGLRHHAAETSFGQTRERLRRANAA